MTTHTPPIASSAMMSAWPGGSSSKVLLLDPGSYPASSVLSNQTYLFNGTTPDWSNTSGTTVMDAAGPLPGRNGAVLSSYDGTNLVLFGGNTQSANGLLLDTWTYSGSWAKATPTTIPAARYGSAMCYLSGAGAVMFGGAGLGETPMNDFWTFSSNNWTQTTFTNGTSPGARSGHSMAASSTTILLFGGKGIANVDYSPWTYTTAGGWTKSVVAAGTGPQARYGAAMCFDTSASLFVLFGGANSAGVILNDLWTTPDGTTWTQATVANGVGPSGKVNASMCYDAVSSKTILFGGYSAELGESDAQTWSLATSTKTWTQL